MTEELYQFVVSDYFATGEGRTICLLITRAYPGAEDWEERPSSENNWTGKLKYSKKFIAARIFVEKFGAYFAQGAENFPREEFLEKYGRHLPEIVLKLLNSEDQPGNLSYSQEFHFNFS
jgi:hypothetical protein